MRFSGLGFKSHADRCKCRAAESAVAEYAGGTRFVRKSLCFTRDIMQPLPKQLVGYNICSVIYRVALETVVYK